LPQPGLAEATLAPEPCGLDPLVSAVVLIGGSFLPSSAEELFPSSPQPFTLFAIHPSFYFSSPCLGRQVRIVHVIRLKFDWHRYI
jgi:hypothetical protein